MLVGQRAFFLQVGIHPPRLPPLLDPLQYNTNFTVIDGLIL